MTRDELHAWAIRHGFTQDTYGHYKRTDKDGRVRRIKVQTRSWRYERQVRIEYRCSYLKDENKWVLVSSAYFGSSHIDPATDRLIVDKRT